MNNLIKKTIDKWGNSQGIRIPKDMLSKIGIDNPVGQTVEIDVKGNSLTIQKKKTVVQLCKNVLKTLMSKNILRKMVHVRLIGVNQLVRKSFKRYHYLTLAKSRGYAK
ncbi:AbrB/MazE/SpoVT family DNA-binding domain-containing protein [Lentilactobacillus kisonensis]|uniref:AbrB/MazE/SpoVT family DNA-binding domain-containing protein n=1 Tax=Lentilactobacillus kisonensis TaxID=481722 RepID=UPI001FB2D32F|nr:AbrB/MazE/SpoVT family DNA-binding domain-containing protein [Lentilactobacillus kisonensis]